MNEHDQFLIRAKHQEEQYKLALDLVRNFALFQQQRLMSLAFIGLNPNLSGTEVIKLMESQMEQNQLYDEKFMTSLQQNNQLRSE